MPPSEPPRSSRSKRRKPAPQAKPLASRPPRNFAPAREPKVHIPRPQAKPLQARPPRTYAPAAEPKVRVTRPRTQRVQLPTPQQVRNARIQRGQIASSQKASAAAAYRAAPVKKRKQIVAKAKATPVSQRTPAQQAALSVHHGRHMGDVASRRLTGVSIAQARALQGRAYQYVDQGRAVENAANAAAKVVHEAKKQDSGLKVGGISLKPGKILKKALNQSALSVGGAPYLAAKAATSTPKPLKESPAETAVKQTQRGAYSVKNVINEDIKRHGVKGFLFGGPKKASASETKVMRQKAKRGFQLKEKTSGADILKTAGVKNKTVRAAGGLVIDVAAESATTPGFGVGSVGARAAARAGRTAERAALEAGAEKAAAKAAGQRAARRVITPAEAARAARSRAGAPAIGPLRQAEQKTVNRAVKRATTRAKREAAGRGVAVRFVGHEIPGSRRATAAVGRAARKVARRGPAKTRAERRVEHETEHVIRTARVEKQAGHAEANRVAAAAHASLRTDEERAAVAHAVDTNNIRSLTPSWRKVLKETKGDKKAAQKIMEERHPDEVRLARAATKLVRSQLKGAHVAERQANVAERTEPENFLTKTQQKELKESVKSQRRQTKEAVKSAQKHEERAAAAAELRQKEAELRAQEQTRVAQARATGRARVQQAQQAGRARVATARVQGKEARRAAVEREQQRRAAQVATTRARGQAAQEGAVSRAEAMGRARVQLQKAKARLAKERKQGGPKQASRVAKAKVDVMRARVAVANARKLPPTPRMSAVRPNVEPAARVSAIRPRAEAPTVEAVAPKTVRAGKAAERYERRAGDVQYQQTRHAAAKDVPTRGRGRGVPIDETHTAWLKRVIAHAKKNDLPSLERAATKMLDEAPKDVAGGYFPRVTEDVARKQLGIAPPKEGATSVRAGTARQATTRTGGKARKDVRPLSTIQAERAATGEAPLSEHPALVVGGRVREARTAVAESNFAQNLASLGRSVTHESQLRPGEELHYLGRTGGKEGKYGLHPDDKVRKGKTPRQYVAMPAGVVERATKANAAVPKFDSRFTRALDAATNAYKGIVTRNPMFHMKNTLGDLHRLVFEVGAPGKARSLVGAAKGARAVRAIEKFQAGGKAPSEKVLGAKISLGSETVTAAELAARLKRHGMIDQGRSMQEQLERELMGQGVKEGNVLRGNARSARGVAEAVLNPPVLTQEAPNTIRATAWIAGKRMGLSDGQAADFSHKFFIDYGKLTPGERQVGRRIAPFYTWTRQALPATLKNFAQNPARYGNMEAARNEWNQMVTGMSEDELDAQMSPFTRSELPFIFPVGHDKNGNPQFKALSASFAVNLLNNLPTSTSVTDLARGGGQGIQTVGGLLNPLIRSPLELGTLMAGRGGVDFRGNPIEDPYKPTKPAPVPEWVKHLPKGLRDELKVSAGEDPKTGKKALVWRGKADYGYRQLPSAARKAIELAYAAERGGVKGKPYETRPGLNAIFAGFGITSGEVSAAVKKSNERFELVKQLGQTNRELNFLPAGVGEDNPTPQWRRLQDKKNAIQKKLDQYGPSKKKKASGLDLGLGGGGEKLDLGLKGSGDKLDLGLGG